MLSLHLSTKILLRIAVKLTAALDKKISHKQSVYKKVKIIIFILVISGMILWAISFVTGFTFVIAGDLPGTSLFEKTPKKGEVVQILDPLDFSEGIWSAYLILGADDWSLSKEFDNNCYVIKDIQTLKDIKSQWKMKISGGDMTTVTSYIVIIKNGIPVWSSGIIVDDNSEGLQSQQFGWAEPIQKGIIKKYIKYFRPFKYPILVF